MCDAISWMNCDVLLCVYSGVSLVNVCTTQAHLQRRTTACTVTFATYFRRSITWHAPKLQMKIGNASVGTAASCAAKLVAIIMEKMTSLLKILLMMILLRRFDVKFVIHFEVVYIMIVFDLVWRKRLRLARTTPNTAIRCPSLIATLKVIAKLAARNVKRSSTDTPVCCRTLYFTWKYTNWPHCDSLFKVVGMATGLRGVWSSCKARIVRWRHIRNTSWRSVVKLVQGMQTWLRRRLRAETKPSFAVCSSHDPDTLPPIETPAARDVVT